MTRLKMLKGIANNVAHSYLSLIVILIATLFFVGCSTNSESNKFNISQLSGEVVEAKLTDKEKKLLQGLDIDKYFIFDAIINDKTIKKADFWVDYYEKGSLINKGSGIGTDIQLPQDKNVRMIFSTQKIYNNSEEKWTFSIFFNGSSGKGSINIKTPEGIQVSNSSSIKEIKIVTGKEIILATIIGTERDIITSSSIDILNNNDETIKSQAIKELLRNNYVYILKCKFK